MRFSRIQTARGCVFVALLLLTATSPAFGQRGQRVPAQRFKDAVLPELEGVPDWLEEFEFEQDGFAFVRIQYDSRGFRGAQWATDYPDADINLVGQLAGLTSLNVAAKPEVLRLTEVTAAENPFLYLSEPGRMHISNAEVESLRAYLTSGGFLMIDDFWGEQEWRQVEDELARVIPDRAPVELPLEHAIFHCVFDLQAKPQVCSINVALAGRDSGVTWERADAREPHYRAILDDDGRIMVLLCHNTDLADGWERAGQHEWYTEEFSVKRAFPMGINAIFYALTN